MSIETQLISFLTIFKAEIRRIFRIWPQTLLPPLINTSLYFAVFGSFLGKNIGEINGVNYIDYIIPGLVMNAIILNSYMNAVSTVFSAKFGKSIEEILISPTNKFIIISSYVLSSAARGIISGSLVCLISLFFTKISIENLSLSIFICVITSIIFANIGFLNGIFAKKFDDTTWVTSFLLTPLTYLGGVFYSIEILPEFWQKITLLNPIYYVISGLKFSFLNIGEFNLFGFLLISFSIIIVTYIFNHRNIVYSK